MSLNHDKTEVLLIRSMTAGIDYGAFESALEKFVNTLEWVIAELSGQGDGTGASPGVDANNNQKPPPPPQNPGGDMGMMV